MDVATVVSVAVLVAVVGGLVWFLHPIVAYSRAQGSADDPVELEFRTGVDDKKEAFPSLDDPESLTLTLVVPAYNEAKRLPKMMDATLAVLKQMAAERRGFSWEVIVVDDGSKDDTVGTALRYTESEGSERVRLLKLARNHGKGGAVRKGMLRGRGKYLLMVDADGATDANEMPRILDKIEQVERAGHGIVCGSRAHLEEESKASRTVLRALVSSVFHLLVEIFAGGHGIRDTQCGFKIFTRNTARRVFPVQHIERWAFDPELLYLATLAKVPIAEMPVVWNEIDGSTLDVVSASIQMARDIVLIRICYALGLWRYGSG